MDTERTLIRLEVLDEPTLLDGKKDQEKKLIDLLETITIITRDSQGNRIVRHLSKLPPPLVMAGSLG
jgi:hypothetical protein